MNWQIDAQNVNLDANGQVNNVATGAENWFASILNHASIEVGAILHGYSVVGINVNEIENMRTAIRDYVKGVQSHLSTVNDSISTDTAFKGAYATALKDYVGAIVICCNNIISSLTVFSDQLVDIKAVYEAKDVELAQRISKTAADTSTMFKEYTETR